MRAISNNLRNVKKFIIALASVFGILILLPDSTEAANYSFTFNPPFAGSLQSTTLVTKSSGTSPFVNPSHSSTPTNYFLSPTRFSSTTATNIVSNISTSGRRGFSYSSGYGGSGQSYCLSAILPTGTLSVIQ
ncbi:hypothetical protein [Halalkalibacter hemicellulosilyticus]|uniref:Uncharacterized protein n=1 Tax=Halalkalibacter hemicellulosilyticusJCM 9152 TaxID=1236971 RepID=W4QCI6_9BACI|nr:hypothetical protein [Halalkalibacter hemicellulosilyticus]GAE29745.1 hypothetical protein JCM9152_1125 [Halalkalibacter hemicellulosilyticusJCM 9152]